jgi:uncharacterized protein
MEFEWDEAKASANLAKHGVSFEDATSIFSDGDSITGEDTRYQYDERRFAITGFIDGRLHVVVYTLRADCVRLISARRANDREQKKHGYRPIQA